MQLKQFSTEHFLFKNYTELSEGESMVIWEGRNHPEIRKWMVKSTPFSFGDHCKFVDGLKQRTDCMYFAVLKEDDIIGSYCINPFDEKSKVGETGKFLMPQYWGHGLGTMVTVEFLDYIFANHIVCEVKAKTLVENRRNQQINLKLGFVVTGQDDIYIYMSKKI